MRDIIITAVIFGLIPFILRMPYVGILTWSWIGYMNPHRLAYGFAYSFPFAQIVAVATIVGMLFSKEKRSIPWTPVTITLVMFIFWTSITTFFALHPEHATDEWIRVLKIQLVVFCTLMVVQDRYRLEMLVWVIALSIAFYGIKGGVFSILTGGQYRVWGPDKSFIAGNNEIAFALCVIFPLLRYLQMTLQKKWMKLAMSGAMILCAVSILASYSRGAFLAGAVMAFFMILKGRRKFALGVAMAVAIPLLLSFMPQQWTERMETIQTYEQDGSAMGRINAWWFAFNLANDRPIVGGGFRAFQPDLFERYAPDPEKHHDSHSIYFEVLGEHGYVGLIIYLLLIWFAFRTGSRVLKLTKGDSDSRWAYDLASMVQVSIIGYLVGGLFIGLAYFDLFYHLIAILVLLEFIVLKSRDQAAAKGLINSSSGEAIALQSNYRNIYDGHQK